MTKTKPSTFFPRRRWAMLASLASAAFTASVAFATPPATVWTGPTITFTHSAATGDLVDHLTTGVAITRGSENGGLYNSITESSATPGVSPQDTEWAVGSLANFSTLTYSPCRLEAGEFPPGDVGTTYVVHLINENIYLSLTLTAWGGSFMSGDRSFSYTRSTPAAVVGPPPTISITSPANGAVFAAPASVSIAATAAVSSGTVTNVQFFSNGIVLTSVQTPPFSVTANDLAAGAYALTAAATAAGISTTSAVVNVSVVTPVTVNLSNSTLAVNNSQITFNYSVNPGLAYVVQGSSNLMNWVSLATNVPTASPASFSDTINPAGAKYYRVGRLPNPPSPE